MENNLDEYFSGKHEVEITNELIQKLNFELDIDINVLQEAKEMGAKWNVIRESIVFPTELF